MDRKKRRGLAGDKASKKLTEQFRLDQLEEEKRIKRQKMSRDGEMAQTLAQQRVLMKLRASRVGALPQSPGVSQICTAVATPEEYAEWRAKALRFMRNKEEKEKVEGSNSNNAQLGS